MRARVDLIAAEHVSAKLAGQLKESTIARTIDRCIDQIAKRYLSFRPFSLARDVATVPRLTDLSYTRCRISTLRHDETFHPPLLPEKRSMHAGGHPVLCIQQHVARTR